jgi:hypothetical protein
MPQSPFLSSIFIKLLDNIVMNQKRCSPALGSNLKKFAREEKEKENPPNFCQHEWNKKNGKKEIFINMRKIQKSWKGTFPLGSSGKSSRNNPPSDPTKPCLTPHLWPLLFFNTWFHPNFCIISNCIVHRVTMEKHCRTMENTCDCT